MEMFTFFCLLYFVLTFIAWQLTTKKPLLVGFSILGLFLNLVCWLIRFLWKCALEETCWRIVIRSFKAKFSGEDVGKTFKKFNPFCEKFMCVIFFLQEDVSKNYFSLCSL